MSIPLSSPLPAPKNESGLSPVFPPSLGSRSTCHVECDFLCLLLDSECFEERAWLRRGWARPGGMTEPRVGRGARKPVRGMRCHPVTVWRGRTPGSSQVWGGRESAAVSCLALPLAEAGREGCGLSCGTSQATLGVGVGLCQCTGGFKAGAPPPCSITATWAYDRDGCVAGKSGFHLGIKEGSLEEAAFGTGCD